MTIARTFGEFISTLTYADLPEAVKHAAKRCFLDWLGSAIAGGGQAPVRMVLDVARGQGGSPESTVIADGTKTSCLMAALVNGAASHVVEMDDLHRASIYHPAAVTIPAAVAVAEREGRGGADLLAAVAAGYEIGIRTALMVGASHYRYWHTTATCGAFGAAAAASLLLGLGPQETAWALGSAGTQAAGLWEFLAESAMSKQLHTGKAAQNGVLAALLAQQGFTGAEGIFEGEKGFCRATSADFNPAAATDGLGARWEMEENGFKHHASCGHTHTSLDAALLAAADLNLAAGDPKLALENIARVRVRLYTGALDLLGGVALDTPYIAKFHLPFCVATALAHGRVGPEAFTRERLGDSVLAALRSRIDWEADPALDAGYPEKWPAEVTITTRDGRTAVRRADYPKGDPKNPLSDAELEEKFRGLVEGIVDEGKAEEMIEKVWRLEEVEGVRELLGK